MGLFFPVLLKNGTIVEAEEVAEVSIPVCGQNWAFANKESMSRIKQLLENVNNTKKRI